MYQEICVLVICVSALSSVVSFIIGYAPLGWGRLAKGLSGYYISPKIGWCLMQIPSLIWAIYFISIKKEIDLIFLFAAHYFNRSILYPYNMKSKKQSPIQVVLSAFLFNVCNGYLQGQAYMEGYPSSILEKLVGGCIFTAGIIINIDSDERLRSLKTDNQSYKIPRGGLLYYISSANYFGQIVQWIGYAVACRSTYPALFSLFTLLFLTIQGYNRAIFNQKNIPNYPKNRWKVIPFIV